MPSVLKKFSRSHVDSDTLGQKRTYSTDPKGAALVTRILKSGATMRTIKAGDFNSLNEVDILELKYYLGISSSKSELENLTLTNYNVSSKLGRVLALLIKSPCLAVRNLSLNQISLDRESSHLFFGALAFSKSYSVYIRQPNISSKDISKLILSLSKMPNLSVLSLEKILFDLEHIETLKDAFTPKSQLKALRFSESSIKSEHLVSIGNLLKSNRSIIDLNLSHNLLSPTGADHLASSLIFNYTLTNLNLEGNNIGPSGCERLSKCLELNTGIKYLNLNLNYIGDLGVESLCRMLKINTSIHSLYLDLNRLTHASGRQISSMLARNYSLKRLTLDSNTLGSGGLVPIASSLKHNSSLEVLSLHDNEINEVGITELFASLQHNSSLQELTMTKVRVDDTEIYSIASRLLKHNRSLKILKLDYDFRGWEQVYHSIQPILTFNFMVYHDKVSSALSVLWASRCFCLNHPANSFLPRELLEAIVCSFDVKKSLSDIEYYRIINFASNRSTLNPDISKIDFLRVIFGPDFTSFPTASFSSLLNTSWN